MRYRRKNSLLHRLQRSYVLLSILPMLIVMLFTFFYSAYQYTRETIDLSISKCEHIVQNINSSINEMYKFTRMIFIRKDNDKYITDYLSDPLPESALEKLKLNRLFYDLFTEFFIFRTDLVGISLQGVNGANYYHYLTNTPIITQANVSSKHSKYSSLFESSVIGTHRLFDQPNESEVFTIIRPLWNFSLKNVVATLAIDFNLDILAEIVSRSKITGGEELLIITSEGRLIYSNSRPYLDQILEEKLLQTIQSVSGFSSIIYKNHMPYYLIKPRSTNNMGIITVSLLSNFTRRILNSARHLN